MNFAEFYFMDKPMSQTGLTDYKLLFRVNKNQKMNFLKSKLGNTREEWMVLSELHTPFDNSEETTSLNT